MDHARALAISSLAILTILSLGCGTLGGTSVFTLQLDRSVAGLQSEAIRVAPVELEAKQHLVGLEPAIYVGWFSADDLAKFDTSLRSTVEGAQVTRQSGSGPLHLYTVLRLYVVNSAPGGKVGTAVLAVTAWCLADGAGTILYDEQFFASKRTGSRTPVGSCKMSVHRSVIGRVAARALYVGARREKPPASLALEGTYEQLNDAVLDLGFPERIIDPLRTWSERQGPYLYHYVEGRQVELEWSKLEQAGLINWKKFIAARSSSK